MAQENEIILKSRNNAEVLGETGLCFKPDPNNYFSVHFEKWWHYFNAEGKLINTIEVENTKCG
jgi:hypothetical protein